MMPYCQYNKCKRVADSKTMLLEKWSTYDMNDPYKRNHLQDVWLCTKHRNKIYKLLQIEEQTPPTN